MSFFLYQYVKINTWPKPPLEKTLKQIFQEAKDCLATAEFFYDPNCSDGVQSKEAKKFIAHATGSVALISKWLDQTAPKCGWNKYLFNPGIDLGEFEEFKKQLKICKAYKGSKNYRIRCDKYMEFFLNGNANYKSYFQCKEKGDQFLTKAKRCFSNALLILKEIVPYDDKLQKEILNVTGQLEGAKKTINVHNMKMSKK
jgi:hypothetical protein